MDFARLVALLNLSTSDNDNEALSATRHANAWLKKHNLQWEDVIGGTKSHSSHRPPPRPPPGHTKSKWTGGKAPPSFDKDFIRTAYQSTKFHEFIAKRGASTQKFMLGLHSYFMKWNNLTGKQYNAFADIWNEFIEG